MVAMLTTVSLLLRLDETVAMTQPSVRVAVRLLLGALIVVLLGYVVIEQIGTWMRRRSGRE